MDCIKRLPTNLKGRDFVCGDIHGSYSCVMRFLQEINFDFEVDRFICAGDLVDRGPENEACMQLLYEPWFYMVKGNHEEIMIAYFDGKPLGFIWQNNGGDWGVRHRSDASEQSMQIRDLVETKLRNLPFLLTVEKKSGGVFHVFHAEVDSVVELTDAEFADEDTFRYIATQQVMDGDTVLWGRQIFYPLYNRILSNDALTRFLNHIEHNNYGAQFGPNLSHIYSGHTVVQRPITYKGQTCLDTCAYGSYPRGGGYIKDTWCGLTVTEPETGKFWFINDREFKETTPIIFE